MEEEEEEEEEEDDDNSIELSILIYNAFSPSSLKIYTIISSRFSFLHIILYKNLPKFFNS